MRLVDLHGPRRPLRRRPLIVGLQALSLAFLVVGCNASPPLPAEQSASSSLLATVSPTAVPVPPTPTPRPILNSVNVALPGVLDTLNPLFSQSPTARAVASLVFPGLVAPDAGGQFAPELATSWSSGDGLTWTFHLDPARRWQDGPAVTSADVGYTLGLIHDAAVPLDPALRSAWQGIQWQTPDAETVVLTVPAAVGAGVLDLATLPILPAHLLASTPASALALLPFSSHPVGSGAYRVVSADSLAATLQLWSTDDLAPRRLTITLAAGGRPTPALAAQPGTGTVTFLPNGTGTAAATAASATLARPVFVFLNTRDATLKDLGVRQALNLAINRQQLVAGPLQGAATPLYGPISAGLPEANGAPSVPSQDMATAAAALQAAGWLPVGGGGRARQGVPLTVTLLADDDPARLAVAQAIAADWATVGVRTTVEAVGLDGLLRDFASTGHFQAAVIGLQQRGVRPDLADLWHTGGVLNISGWSDALADAALDATHAVDQDAERTGYQRFARRFADELPAIPLYLPTARYALTGVRWTIGTINDPADILRDVLSWRAAP